MPHRTDDTNTLSQASHAITYQGSAGSPASFPYNPNTSCVSLSCWRCYAPLSLFRGTLVGEQVYCMTNPCVCAAPAPSTCHCEPSALQQAPVSSHHSGIEYPYPYYPYAYQQGTYVPPIEDNNPSVTQTAFPATAVGSRGQTPRQMERDLQYVGAHLGGVMPPTSPSPDIITDERSHGTHSSSLTRSGARHRHHSHRHGHGNGRHRRRRSGRGHSS
jgi:hypothetical protein